MAAIRESEIGMRRKEKREREQHTNYFFEFEKIKRHFFKHFNEKLNQVRDPRHSSYITYDSDLLLLMIILKNICNLTSMRSMTDQFNKAECIENMGRVLGIEELDELPHYDTINDFLSDLEPIELERIRTGMINELLQKRCLEHYRLPGKYWGIIVDGTGLFCFHEKHCAHCLRKEYTDKQTGEKRTVYMHHVLEAKLVVGPMVLSIASEFIENESEDVSKQDCELKAFYRLAEKLKHAYPRLPICILADSLYACEGIFQRCHDYRWHYLLRFKEGRIPSIAHEFQQLKDMENEEHVEYKENETTEAIEWVNAISYQKHTVHMLACTIRTANEKSTDFLFLTSMPLTRRNAKALVHAWRSRWKIENEGFNHQKNIRYHIEHVNSHDYTAMKNHYVLTQIADILMQLYENGAAIIKQIRKRAKEISSYLLEAIRTRRVTDEDIDLLGTPMQVRWET